MKKIYQFEVNDVRAILTLFNLFCIIFFGLIGYYCGLIIAILGLVKDFLNKNKRLSDFIIHSCGIILNLYGIIKLF